jgi:hypothetical protein
MNSWMDRWRMAVEPDRPAFVSRTCTRCAGRYSLDPLEWKAPPAPPDRWVCSRCPEIPPDHCEMSPDTARELAERLLKAAAEC